MKKEKFKQLCFKIILPVFSLTALFLIMETVFYLKYRASINSTKESVEKIAEMLRNRQFSTKKPIHFFMYYDENGVSRLVPNSIGLHRSYDDFNKSVRININSFGLRGPEPAESPDKRIIFIGDSIVFNGGVPYGNTFTSIIQKELNKEKTEGNTEVLNFGTTDTGIEQYYLKLKYHALDFNPDNVFLMFYLNDAVSPQKYLGYDSGDLIEKIMYSGILSKSHFISYFREKYRRYKYSRKEDFKRRFRWVERWKRMRHHQEKNEFFKLVHESDLDWGAAWVPESWKKVRFYLKKIKKLCCKKGIQLTVFCTPVEAQVYAEEEWESYDYPQQKLAAITEELEIMYFDLLPALKKYSNKKLFADICHYNSEGNKVLAFEIENIIKSNNILGKSKSRDKALP